METIVKEKKETKATIKLPQNATVKTIDADSELIDITSLFSLGGKGMIVRPSDKVVMDKEIDKYLKAGDALSVKNELYHKEYVVRGNQALYELLAGIYSLALQINMSASRVNILEAMRNKLKDRDIKTQYTTPAMTTIVKYVVGADRATAANYSRVLTIAMDENLSPDELAAYISRRGGISQIHGTEAKDAAKKLGEKENKERMDILRDYFQLQRWVTPHKFKYEGEVIEHNSDKQTAKETATFCFFMTVYDDIKDEYYIINANDLGKTYEDALLRVLFKDAPNDLNRLRKGLRKYEEQLIADKSVPDGLAERLKKQHEQQDFEQAKLIEAQANDLISA